MKGKLRRSLIVLWASLLPISWWFMSVRDQALPEGPEWHEIKVPVGEGIAAPMRYRKFPGDPSKPAVLLVHGSPMASSCFDPLLGEMGRDRTLLVPDLPGFGFSKCGFTDYSFTAHAGALQVLLKQESSGSVHVVAYSQGGGPALELAGRDPAVLASLTLLSSIGTQEYELSGDYFLNHVLHGAQWMALASLRWGVPHFGALDDLMLNTRYAKNFYQGDLRPLRQRLESLDLPVLIQHGRTDIQVPPSAAREHQRIVPQSELVWVDGGHLILMRQAGGIASGLEEFFHRVEDGSAPTRHSADQARIAAAARPFDASSVMALSGTALLLTAIAIALATLASEDLACIAAGLLVARGLIPLPTGIVACFAGIWIGDMALYALGRFGGNWALARWPLRNLVPEEALTSARGWLLRRSGAAIFASRFMPGTRLPLYLAAGLVRLPVLPMMGWFALASVLWSVPVVSLIAYFGERASAWLMASGTQVFPLALLLLVFALLALRLLSLLATHRGRRILRAGWERTVRWEFWPPWFFYPPVAVAVIVMGLRRRSPLAFTAANPGIPHSGIAGESKSAILRALSPSGAVVPFLFLPDPIEERETSVASWMREQSLDFPIVVKPDAGERGRDVRIIPDDITLTVELQARPVPTIVQAFAPGEEFGIFYLRHPGEEQGRIFSLTIKLLPSVRGDGRRTLEDLIFDDERAFLSHRHFRRLHKDRLSETPAVGEVVPLATIGSHCRGALFLDGASLITPELEFEIDRIAKTFPGFHFGRFDIRCPDQDHLRRGEGLRILELNGVTSEATHIYHPHTPLLTGYRTLIAQWRNAYDIGLANHVRGAEISRMKDVAKLLWNHQRNNNS